MSQNLIYVKLDDVHAQIIESMIPFFGKDSAEVMKNITIRWIEENIGSEKITKLTEIGAIRGITLCE